MSDGQGDVKSKTDVLSSLVPFETHEEVLESLQDDVHGLWLYNLIRVRACDVDFTWKTSMLMHQIGTWAEEAETLDDFIRALKYYRHGRTLYQKCKKYVSEIFNYFHENPRE